MKHFEKIVLLLLFAQCSGLQAQALQGMVMDEATRQPLAGAAVSIARAGQQLSQNSDASGRFEFDGLAPGYYVVTLSAVGYDTLVASEIDVAAGKQRDREFLLRATGRPLREVVISTGERAQRPLMPLGEIALTREQTFRYPAMFFDPGRLAAAYAGVSSADDGTNMISIRGNSPAAVRWRLEGVDIVNPNHLPNAGTLDDRPAAASGGVLMFSSQLLDNASLLNGAYPAGYGDALGGIFDMHLRRGNMQKAEFTAQASLVGLDVSAEGPLGKKKGSARARTSYLANYRYSTVGLLGQLGVSFGDEQIDFQDLSFTLAHTTRRGGQLMLFGMGGLSTNRFRYTGDTSEITLDKQYYDIDFASMTGVLGLRYQQVLSASTFLTATVAYSEQSNNREQTRRYTGQRQMDLQAEGRLSSSLTIRHRWAYGIDLSAGVQTSRQQMHYDNTDSLWRGDYSLGLIQPWVQLQRLFLNKRLSLQVGIHGYLIEKERYERLEPRLLADWRASKKHRWSFSAGVQRAVEHIALRGAASNPALSVNAGLKYTWTPSPRWQWSAEGFSQLIDGLAAAYYDVLGVSYVYTPLYDFPARYRPGLEVAYLDRVRNFGIELSGMRRFSEDWFVQANATLFQSDGGGFIERRPTRWALDRIANLTAGREWGFSRKNSNQSRKLGLNGRFVWTGGGWFQRIDLAQSRIRNTTVFSIFSDSRYQEADYFRADLRVYWKRSIGDRRNSTLALDIQNATNRQNVAYRYYEPATKNVEVKYQLGLIPNLSWRLEF